MMPKYRFWCVAGMFNVQIIDFVHGNVHLDDGDIRKIKDGCLLQFTCLKDKNGKEIFEGDIVIKADVLNGEYIPFTEPFIIVNEGFSFFVEHTDSETPEHMKQWHLYPDRELYKVIGNIYENPELLKKKMI